jgi:uncharacterized membrane protein
VTAPPARPIGHRIDQILLLAAKILMAAGLAIRLVGATGVADGVIAAGLVALMATPLVRLVSTMVDHLRRRDWLTLAASLGVTAVLVWSILTALR